MTLTQRLLQITTGRNRLGSTLCLCSAVVFGLAFAPQAQGGFIGPYDINNFVLTNTNADGFAYTPNGGLTLVLFGGNNGSALAGTTDFLITAIAPGLIEFQYLYSCWDIPEYDSAGYLVGGTYVPLANSGGQSANIVFPVSSGVPFGWRVVTEDNLGEPGILTIANFSAPAGEDVPEPGGLMLLCIGVAAIAAGRIRKR